MKNFLLFTLEFPPDIGGVSNYYQNLVRYWGVDKIFVLTDNNKNNQENRLKNGNIFYKKLISTWIIPKWLPAFWHLYRKIRKNKIDHVVVGHILPLGTVAYFLSKWLNFKYSIILHGMDFSFATKTTQKRILTKKILKNAQKIVCANSFTAKLVNEFDKKLGAKTMVANPGVRTSYEMNKKLEDKLKSHYSLWGKIIMFSLGRLVERKGFGNVIDVMNECVKKELDLVYIIAGDGEDKEKLKTKLINLSPKAERSVKIIGKVSEEEKMAWLDLCDFFIMPSFEKAGDFEGFGIVYLEANVAGKAVIAGDSGGTRDAVVHGYNGILVDPQNKEQLIDAILTLAKDKPLRDKLGKQGKERAINEFHWKNQILKIHRALKNRI